MKSCFGSGAIIKFPSPTRLRYRWKECTLLEGTMWPNIQLRRSGLDLASDDGRICQKLPRDFEKKLIEFQPDVIQKRLEKDYPQSQISNANETPVYFDMPVAYTVNEKGAKEMKVRIAGYEKQQTTLTCCAADGRKLPVYIIFKRKTLPAWKVFPKNVVQAHRMDGWPVPWLRNGCG